METTLLTVLIADQSQLIRSRLSELLEEELDVCVICCEATAESVFGLGLRRAPWCVVVDPRPEEGGLELVRTLRRAYPSSRLIVLTNQSSVEFGRTSMEHGADAVLAKWTDFDRLVDLLRVAMENA